MAELARLLIQRGTGLPTVGDIHLGPGHAWRDHTDLPAPTVMSTPNKSCCYVLVLDSVSGRTRAPEVP